VTLKKAELKLAVAEYRRAVRYWERIRKADMRGITRNERDNAETDAQTTRAALHQSLANLAGAELYLTKVNVLAPASGKVRFTVGVGEAVSHESSFVAEILTSNSHFEAGSGAVQEMNVYPRTKGRVTAICVKEGDVVKRGDLLCRLDDGQAALLVDQRKADLEVAEAECRRAERNWQRMQSADARGITQKEYDDAVSNVEKAKAVVDLARAQFGIARVKLVSARVVAPTSGKIVKIKVQPEEWVNPDKTVIVQMSCNADMDAVGAFPADAMRTHMEALRENDPAKYVQLTNNLGRMQERRQQRTKNLLDALASVNLLCFTPEQQQTHEALMSAISKREALLRRLNPKNEDVTESHRKAVFEELRQLDQVMCQLKSSERNTLFTKLLDFQNEDVTDKQRTVAFEVLLELLPQVPTGPPVR